MWASGLWPGRPAHLRCAYHAVLRCVFCAAEPNSATMLSGMAVELTQGDPFLKSLTGKLEGPIKAYKQGREAGLYRKVRAAERPGG